MRDKDKLTQEQLEALRKKATWKRVKIKARGTAEEKYYVLDRLTAYSSVTKNTIIFESIQRGYLPKGETDLNKFLPIQKQTKTSESLKETLESVEDCRQQGKVVYPLPIVLLVIVLAGLSGFTSCVQIAMYWKTNREKLSRYFPEIPPYDISHDTVRRIVSQLGAKQSSQLLQRLTQPLIKQADKRLLSVDGQAVRASRDETDRSPYILNVRDCSNSVTITQELIGAKENEITHSSSLISSLCITGAIVIADALNTQKQFASAIIQGGADYVLALKANQKKLYEYVKGLFEMNAKGIVCGPQEISLEHGRIETRSVKILSGSRLPESLTKNWIGLEEGCIIEARTESEVKKTKVKGVELRYYISSINYDEKDPKLAQQIGQYIRGHWHIENKTHWVLDVVFNQDRLQTLNPEYLKGRTSLNKIALNILESYKKRLVAQSGKEEPSIKSLQVMMTNIDEAVKCLCETYK